MVRSAVVPLTDPSGVGEARRRAAQLARNLGFSETEASRVGLVVTEAATNVIKHAGRGELLLRALQDSDVPGVEVLALNRAPGIADVDRCLQDGYSTAGTSGTGLGAIWRLSNYAEIFSQPEFGTVLLAQIWANPSSRPQTDIELGAVCLAMAGETICGDIWAIRCEAGRHWLLVADGLGHGPLASSAAEEAERVFRTNHFDTPAQYLNAAHGPLRATRGASVALAELDLSDGIVRYSGVGNIAGGIIDGESSRSLVSHNGTLGHELHRIQEFSYPWRRTALLIVHSDGLNTRWNLEKYPGLKTRHPAVIAGVLYRDFARNRDDVTVVVLRERAEASPETKGSV